MESDILFECLSKYHWVCNKSSYAHGKETIATESGAKLCTSEESQSVRKLGKFCNNFIAGFRGSDKDLLDISDIFTPI